MACNLGELKGIILLIDWFLAELSIYNILSIYLIQLEEYSSNLISKGKAIFVFLQDIEQPSYPLPIFLMPDFPGL